MFIVNFLLLFVVIRKGFEQRSRCSKPLIPGKFYDWDIFDSSNYFDMSDCYKYSNKSNSFDSL